MAFNSFIKKLIRNRYQPLIARDQRIDLIVIFKNKNENLKKKKQQQPIFSMRTFNKTLY